MPLSLDRRPVGDIAVVTCSGRIVEGVETAVMQQFLTDLLAENPNILLHLGGVDFVDSSGLGLLVRFLTRARQADGNLKLCAPSPRIREALRATKLDAIFEPANTEVEAIAQFYHHQQLIESSIHAPTILCVDPSADVLAYVRELLRQSGYRVLSANNLPDALTLLTATRPKVVVIGAEFRHERTTNAADAFNRLADERVVVELPAEFGRREAGDAGHAFLDQIRAVV